MIARRLGVSRERARQVRRATGAGPCAERAVVEDFADFVQANLKQVQGLRVATAVSLSGVPVPWNVARRVLRSAGVAPYRPAQKWADLDWRLPNRDLAALCNLDPRRVAGIRAYLNVGPALWNASGGRSIEDPAYAVALGRAQEDFAPNPCCRTNVISRDNSRLRPGTSHTPQSFPTRAKKITVHFCLPVSVARMICDTACGCGGKFANRGCLRNKST